MLSPIVGVSKMMLLILLLALMAGCATMSKDECLTAHWRSVGYEDGARGYPAARIGEHRRACASYHVVPDLREYATGREEGLRQWCMPGNGYYQGTRGTTYNGVCPQDMEPAFQAALDRGFEVYDYRRAVEDLEHELHALHHELDDTLARISRIEEEMIREELPPARRRDLLDELRAAERLRGRLLLDLAESEGLLIDRERDLARIEAKNMVYQ